MAAMLSPAQPRSAGHRPWHRLGAQHPAPLRCRVAAASQPAAYHEADVVVVGAGIIGISIARALLQQQLSVTLLERHQPCYGATGAGQGYIWLAHRKVGSPAWELAAHSKRLWEREIASGPLAAAIEWQEAGSLLLAATPAEGEQLAQRQQALAAAGVATELLGASELRAREPALRVAPGMTGLLLRSDCQVNGRLAAHAWLADCRTLGGQRFAFWQGDGAARLELSAEPGTRQAAVTDSGRRLVARRAIVLAAGAWSGQLLADALGGDAAQREAWRLRFQPRRGHLLELQPPAGMAPVTHGLMELGYAGHYTAPGSTAKGDPLGITFTATTSASGSLLVGSSREFAGFDRGRSAAVEAAILARAAEFLPQLAGVSAAASQTRVGLRPFSPMGPVVGALPGQPGLLIAGGHEGSGLTLAPATAEIIAASVLGERLPAFAAGLAPTVPAPRTSEPVSS